jgi:hypothetical protein
VGNFVNEPNGKLASVPDDEKMYGTLVALPKGTDGDLENFHVIS